MHSIAAEINQRMISLQIELVHVAGVAYDEADALSRLCQGKSVPSHLAEVDECPRRSEMRPSFLLGRGILRRPDAESSVFASHAFC